MLWKVLGIVATAGIAKMTGDAHHNYNENKTREKARNLALKENNQNN